MIAHIYPSVLQAVSDGAMQGAWAGVFQGYRGEAMHYLGYELPRISIPRTSVNRVGEARPRPVSFALPITHNTKGTVQLR